MTDNATPSFSGAQVAAFRLQRHHLDQRAPKGSLEAVIGDVCGIQAQVMAMARVGLWARLGQLTVDDVERAQWKKRSIIKSWSMRSALHLLRSSDLRVFLAGLLRTRLPREQSWISQAGLDEAATTAFIVKALRNGPLTRRELVGHLAKMLGTKTKTWTDGGWGRKTVGADTAWHLVRPAVARGLVCFGPSNGQEITFVRVDQWLRKQRAMPDEDVAEAALLKRYLHSYGPADAKDFRSWAGVRVRHARPILERIQDELLEVEVDGRRRFMLRRDLSDLEMTTLDDGVVRLLPSFDPFMLGHYDRAHLVDRIHYKRVYREAGWLSPVVLVDGRVVGTWSYLRQPRGLRVEVRMFAPIQRDIREGIEGEVGDLARFLEARSLALEFT